MTVTEVLLRGSIVIVGAKVQNMYMEQIKTGIPSSQIDPSRVGTFV